MPSAKARTKEAKSEQRKEEGFGRVLDGFGKRSRTYFSVRKAFDWSKHVADFGPFRIF